MKNVILLRILGILITGVGLFVILTWIFGLFILQGIAVYHEFTRVFSIWLISFLLLSIGMVAGGIGLYLMKNWGRRLVWIILLVILFFEGITVAGRVTYAISNSILDPFGNNVLLEQGAIVSYLLIFLILVIDIYLTRPRVKELFIHKPESPIETADQ